jgi:hypothetical protein
VAGQVRFAPRQLCGDDPAAHLETIEKFRQAGFDELYVANTGRHVEGLFELYATSVFPKLGR